MNRNEDITNEQQPSSRPTLPGWLFRLMMFHEKTKVKGKTKAKHLEVSRKMRTFAFESKSFVLELQRCYCHHTTLTSTMVSINGLGVFQTERFQNKYNKVPAAL
jgi:hypothetical protein